MQSLRLPCDDCVMSREMMVSLALWLSVYCIHQVRALLLYEAPLSKNSTLGSSAKFACNVSGNIAVFWYVDGVYHNDVTVKARGISSDNNYDETSDSTRSVLTVACSEQNNNTFVQCSGFLSGQFINSDEVILRIQGYLVGVAGLIGNQITSTQVVFIWSKPFSLEGVPVLGYQVHVVNASSLSADVALWNNVTLTETTYAVSKPSSIDCAYVNITVYAVNDVGPGDPVHYHFRFVECPASANWTIVDVFKQYDNNSLRLVTKLEAGIDCAQAIPSSASLVLNDENMVPGSCTATGSDYIELEDVNATLTLLITFNCSSLSDYESTYEGDLILENIGGSVSLPGIQFDTYVLTNVSLTTGLENFGDLCITCVFVLNVENRYCSIRLEDNGGYSLITKAFQEDGGRSGNVCISGLATSVYSLLVCSDDCTINGSSQLTFIYQNLSIIGLEQSSSIMPTPLYVNSLLSSQTYTFVTSPTTIPVDNVFIETRTIVTIVGSGILVVLLVMIFITTLSVMYYLRRKRKRVKDNTDPITSRNEAYSSVFIHSGSNNIVQRIEVEPCSAYGVIGK